MIRATRKGHWDYAFALDAISEMDMAWFGGWLSADGSIKATDSVPTIRFQITDADPLERMAAMFGNTVSGPTKPNARALGSKMLYSWGIRGRRAKLILDRVYPWLSDRYKARADAFGDWEPRSHAGRKLTPADVHAIRARLGAGKHGVGRMLAMEYGVSNGMISSIKVGRAWSEELAG